jgi:iron complex transport system permease protein
MRMNILEIFRKRKTTNKIVLFFLIIILVLLFFLSINLGKAVIDITNITKILLAKILFNDKILKEISDTEKTIILDIRLPRILTAIIVGAGLAISGTIFQSLLMNPLADSYTLGISGGAAFGAVIALYINIFIPGFKLSVTMFAFLGAFLTLGLVILIARGKSFMSSANLIIAGIIVSSIFQAAICFIKNLSGESVQEIIFWLMGSISAKSWSHVILSFLVITICTIICFFYSEDLNIMCMGDKEAKSLGINTNRIRIILLICASLITAVCVSISGIIGFIGLIVPHLLRFLIGSDNKIILPFSLLLGAIILLSADTVVRALLNIEIPIGVITTFIGGPFFIYIFIRKNKNIY